MLKRAFPAIDGKIIFRLDKDKHGEKGIDVDMFLPSIMLTPEAKKRVNTIDL